MEAAAGNPNGDLHFTKERKPRVRMTQACDYCVKRRRRCSGTVPCDLCNEAGIDCVFQREAKKRGPPKGYKPPKGTSGAIKVEGRDSGSSDDGAADSVVSSRKPTAPPKPAVNVLPPPESTDKQTVPKPQQQNQPRRQSLAKQAVAGAAAAKKKSSVSNGRTANPPVVGRVASAGFVPEASLAGFGDSFQPIETVEVRRAQTAPVGLNGHHHQLAGATPNVAYGVPDLVAAALGTFQGQQPRAGISLPLSVANFAGVPMTVPNMSPHGQSFTAFAPTHNQAFLPAAANQRYVFDEFGAATALNDFNTMASPPTTAAAPVHSHYHHASADNHFLPSLTSPPLGQTPPGFSLPTPPFVMQTPSGYLQTPPVPTTPSRLLFGDSQSSQVPTLDIATGTGLTPQQTTQVTVDEDYFSRGPSSSTGSGSGSGSTGSGSGSGSKQAQDQRSRDVETDFDRFRREMESRPPVIPQGAPVVPVALAKALENQMGGTPRSGISDELGGQQGQQSDESSAGEGILIAQPGLPYIDYAQTTQAGFQVVGEDGTITVFTPGTVLAAIAAGHPAENDSSYFASSGGLVPSSVSSSSGATPPSSAYPLSVFNLPGSPNLRDLDLLSGIPSTPSLFADLPPMPPLAIITHLVLAFPQYMDSLSTIFHRTFWESIHTKPQFLLISMAALVAPLCQDLGPNRFSIGASLLERARRMLMIVGSTGGRDAVAAMFFCGVAISTAWKKDSGPMMDALMNMTITTARTLRLNIEEEETGEGGVRSMEGWIEREMDRRMWWTCFMMDKIGTVLSDRPPLIPHDSPHPHLPIPESLWAAPPQADGSYPEPIGVNAPAAFMTIPDRILATQPDWTGWSEWGIVVMIHRALGEAVRWLQYCRGHKLDPYAVTTEAEKLHVRLARDEAIAMFKETLAFIDLVYSRLPPWFHLLETDPDIFLDPKAPAGGVPREKRIESAHLLTYIHTTYAILFAPKVPDPDLPSTNLWIKHQPIFGIPCAASGPAEREGPGAFPFAMDAPWLALGPEARLKPGTFCPSPAALCHFHTNKVSKILKGLLLQGDEVTLRRLPPFVMWCSAQTFFYRFLLANLTYAKLVARGTDHTVAIKQAIMDTEEHMTILDPMRKRWKAADAGVKHMRHMITKAIENGGKDFKENAVFSAVGIIHENYGKGKVDRAIAYVETVDDDE